MCQPGSGPLPNLGVPTAMEGVLAFRDGTGSEVVALPSPGALVGCSRRVGTQEGRLGQQHPTLLLETVLMRVTGSPSSWDHGSRPVPTVVLCAPALPRVAQVQARAWPAQGWTSTPTPSEGKGRSHPTCEPRLGLGAGQGMLVSLAFSSGPLSDRASKTPTGLVSSVRLSIHP